MIKASSQHPLFQVKKNHTSFSSASTRSNADMERVLVHLSHTFSANGRSPASKLKTRLR
jgi:hypothetical protein